MSQFITVAMKPIAFLKRDFLVAIGYRLQFAGQLVGIFVTVFMFYYVSKMVGQGGSSFLDPYGGDYFSFALVGVALTDFLMISVSTFSQETRKAQVLGTLEAMLVTPTSISVILFSSYLYSFLFTMIRMLLYFAIGWIFFGMHFNPGSFLEFLAVLLLAIMPFWGIGLISSGFIIVFKQGSPISWLVGSFSGLLAGVLYPVEVLPGWLQTVAWFVPLTHGLEACRQVLLKGSSLWSVRVELLTLIVFSFVLLALGFAVIRYSLFIARRDGTLLHY